MCACLHARLEMPFLVRGGRGRHPKLNYPDFIMVVRGLGNSPRVYELCLGSWPSSNAIAMKVGGIRVPRCRENRADPG